MRPRVVRRRPAFTNLSRSDVSRESTALAVVVESSHVNGKRERTRPAPPSRPTIVVLNFRQLGFNAMVACMNSSSKVQYHISVHMNCFVPSSFVTVVRRGNVDGESVGSFEMGITTQRATVNMYGVEKRLDWVLSRAGKKTEERSWQWRWGNEPEHTLCWHKEGPVRYCYMMDEAGRRAGIMVAAFTCQTIPSIKDGVQSQPASLNIYPHGLRLADHIFVSALVVERKRLTPSVMGFNMIFN